MQAFNHHLPTRFYEQNLCKIRAQKMSNFMSKIIVFVNPHGWLDKNLIRSTKYLLPAWKYLFCFSIELGAIAKRQSKISFKLLAFVGPTN